VRAVDGCHTCQHPGSDRHGRKARLSFCRKVTMADLSKEIRAIIAGSISSLLNGGPVTLGPLTSGRP